MHFEFWCHSVQPDGTSPELDSPWTLSYSHFVRWRVCVYVLFALVGANPSARWHRPGPPQEIPHNFEPELEGKWRRQLHRMVNSHVHIWISGGVAGQRSTKPTANMLRICGDVFARCQELQVLTWASWESGKSVFLFWQKCTRIWRFFLNLPKVHTLAFVKIPRVSHARVCQLANRVHERFVICPGFTRLVFNFSVDHTVVLQKKFLGFTRLFFKFQVDISDHVFWTLCLMYFMI